MTICNMSIEAGSRVGLIAVDKTTLDYVEGRPYAPKDNWEQAANFWQELKSDDGVDFDKVIEIDAIKNRATSDMGNITRNGYFG